MKVRIVHARRLDAAAAEVGRLVDSLASREDRLWPRESWPPMRFDRPLGVGAIGGHGPIWYTVETYEPGAAIQFRFEAPAGFDGFHRYEVEGAGDGATILRHVLEMDASGPALVSWPLAFRWLHDALLEDSLAKAARSLGEPAPHPAWSPYVRFLRALFRPRRSRHSGGR